MMTPDEIRVVVEAMRRRHLAGPNRRDHTAMGIEGAITLVAAVERHAVRIGRRCRVVDLGSGFSSSLLRWLAQQMPLDVWTVDHEWKWLGTTLLELERERVSTEHCHHLSAFEALPLAQSFDVMFVDVGPTACRVDLARRGRLREWLAPDGLMLLDDWHMPHYRTVMEPLLESQGFVVKVCRGSGDVLGRYLAEARPVGVT